MAAKEVFWRKKWIHPVPLRQFVWGTACVKGGQSQTVSLDMPFLLPFLLAMFCSSSGGLPSQGKVTCAGTVELNSEAFAADTLGKLMRKGAKLGSLHSWSSTPFL